MISWVSCTPAFVQRSSVSSWTPKNYNLHHSILAPPPHADTKYFWLVFTIYQLRTMGYSFSLNQAPKIFVDKSILSKMIRRTDLQVWTERLIEKKGTKFPFMEQALHCPAAASWGSPALDVALPPEANRAASEQHRAPEDAVPHPGAGLFRQRTASFAFPSCFNPRFQE